MVSGRKINLGGSNLKLETIGVDDGLEKLNLLVTKLEEAKSLINEIASMEVDVKLTNIKDDLTSD